MPTGIHPCSTLWTISFQGPTKHTSNATIWTSTLSHPTITESMPPNVQMLCSRSILSLPSPQLTGTARYNSWMIFFPQVELTLNLPQFSQWDHMKSANKEVNDKFDYNKTLLAPLGTKGLVYNDPATCASWGPHGTNAYYVGQALKYYQCLKFYMPGTRQYQVADTWCLYSTHCTIPTLSPMERTILEAMDNLTWHCPNFHQSFFGKNASYSEPRGYPSPCSPPRHIKPNYP
jgi:hypothetical protein